MFDQKVDDLDVLHFGLDHEPQPAVPVIRRQRRREPVDITCVVDRDHGAAALRDVVQAVIRDPGPDGPCRQADYYLQRAEDRLHVRYPGASAGPDCPPRAGGAPTARRAAFSTASSASIRLASASDGAPPPNRCGTQYSPGGCGPYASCTCSSRCCIRECSSPVSSAGGRVGAIGSPTATEIGTFGRHMFLGYPLVQIRCAPRTMCGTIGTSAAIAMRAAPDLKSLISKLRLIVASGETPTSSASFS